MPADALGERLGVREPILLRSVLHDREIEVALTMARIEPLSTQPGPLTTGRILVADCRFRGATDMRR